MPIDSDAIANLVEAELAKILDRRVTEHVRGLLVAPRVELRAWDYGPPGAEHPCWIVLDDTQHSETAIAYCEHGFGPKSPWGLLFSGDDGARGSMGMDSGWFATFTEAYFNSFASTALAVWRVYRVASDRSRVDLTGEMTWEDAWKRCEELRRTEPASRFDVDQDIYPRT